MPDAVRAGHLRPNDPNYVPPRPRITPIISPIMSDALTRLRREVHVESDPSFAAHGWRPPKEVRLEGNDLQFSRELDAGRVLFPRDGLLTRFVRLEHAPARDIEGFARQWGRLYLCAHGLPWTHRYRFPAMRIPLNVFLPPADADRPPEPVPPDPAADPPPAWWPTHDLDELRMRTEHSWGDSEPLEGWRHLAGRMAGVFEAAAVLDADDEPSASTWERSGGPLGWKVVQTFHWRGPALREYLCVLVSQLIALTAPTISLTPSGLAIGGGLAPTLAMQLALAIAREDTDFLPCMEPGCTNPASHPRRGATPYCGYHLNHGVRRRDELRRRREREREKAQERSG
jgi:hypothetical protein